MIFDLGLHTIVLIQPQPCHALTIETSQIDSKLPAFYLYNFLSYPERAGDLRENN
jgi:hypothetical protein